MTLFILVIFNVFCFYSPSFSKIKYTAKYHMYINKFQRNVSFFMLVDYSEYRNHTVDYIT